MTGADREKLLARIKALYSKTTGAGATEAEELAAAEKARELIEKYQLDMGAEELKKEGFVQKTIDMEPSRFAFARRILQGTEKFCEVKCWYMTSRQVVAFGLRSDVELAAYLIESLTTFTLAGADLHIATERKMAIALGTPMTSAQSRQAYHSYLIGCANRINVRLREMTAERGAQTAKPGSYGALITLDKPALIEAEMDRCGIHLCTGSALTGASNGGSFDAGSAHGAKASFGRPVGGGRIAGLIGNR
jgi:Protein of unknown function (DUF2786)